MRAPGVHPVSGMDDDVHVFVHRGFAGLSGKDLQMFLQLLRTSAVRKAVRQVNDQIRRAEEAENLNTAHSNALTDVDLEVRCTSILCERARAKPNLLRVKKTCNVASCGVSDYHGALACELSVTLQANNTSRGNGSHSRRTGAWVKKRLTSLRQRIKRKLGPSKYKDKTYDADLHVQGYSSATNTVVVVAALIATLSFAALLQPPGGIQSDEEGLHGIAKLAGTQAFQAFYVTNGMALFVALLTILILTSVVPRSHNQARVLYEQGKVLVWIATMLTVLSFSTASYIVAGPEHRMLAWIMFVGAGATIVGLFGTVGAVSVKRKIDRLRSRKRRAELMAQQLQGRGEQRKVHPWARLKFAVLPTEG